MHKLIRPISLLVAAALAVTLAAVTMPSPAYAQSYGPYPAKFAIDGRGSMNPYDRVETDAYLAGDDVHIRCQDWGMTAGGSTLWIYTTDGYWIPDAYVTTGTNGRLSGVPLCANIGIDGEPSDDGINSGPYPAKFAIDGRGSMDPSDRVRTDAYLGGDPVYIRCQDYGLSAGGSTLWIYTTDGYWIPDAYVTTGTNAMVDGIPRCITIGINGTPDSGGANAGPYPAKFAIDGRGSPDPDDRIRTDAYLGGDPVYIRCQDYGLSAGGSTLWIYTTDGYWIPDAYVTTGTNGRLSGVPLCSDIGIDGGSGGDGRQFRIRTTLNGYYGKSLDSGNVWDKYPEGGYITLVCQAYGEVNYGGSALWGLTSDGLWVPDYYVITGSNSMVMEPCDGDSPGGGGGGGRYLVKTTLNGYYEKSLNADNVWDKYPGGSYVTIVCQAYGEYNYGGYAVWDYTSDGLWIPDYYVSTGSWDIVMDRCDDDPKPGEPDNPSVPDNPPTGSVPLDEVRDRIVNAAYGQLGTHEWGDNCNPYGNGGGVVCGAPWCTMFASWTWQQAGMDLYFPYSGTFQTWGRNHGLLKSKSNIKPGDIVLYGTGYYDSHHSGVVVDVNPANGYITTIEGNYGNQVTKVGPFDPYNPGSVHTYDNIYAVVSPVSDGTKDWNTGSGVESASNFGESPNDDVCTRVYRSGGMRYQLCLQAQTSSPAGTYGAYRTTKFRGRLAVHYDRRSGDPSRSAVQTTMNLYVPGSGSDKATCSSSLLADNVKRTCYTDWISVGSRGMTSVTAEVTVDGSRRPKLRAGSLPMYGYKQETSTYCGPAVVKSSSMTMRANTAPDQDEIADLMETDSLGFTLPSEMADGMSAYTPIASTGLSFYDWYTYGTSNVPRILGDEHLRDGLEAGQPGVGLVQYAYLPWADGGLATVRHYLMVYGYAGSHITGDPYTSWSVDTFQVWDTASADSYLMTEEDLVSASASAAGIGDWDMILPQL